MARAPFASPPEAPPSGPRPGVPAAGRPGPAVGRPGTAVGRPGPAADWSAGVKAAVGTVRRHRPALLGGPHRRRRLLIAVLAVVLAVLVAAIALTRSGGGGTAWHTVWVDNFDGPAGSAPSSRNWLEDTGTSYPGGAAQWGTGELETYTGDSRNVALDGRGDLRITPVRDASGAWTSARLETRRDDFGSPASGSLEVSARIRLPAGGQGYLPAFWMLGQPFRPAHVDWPGAGELDVVENLGSEPGTVHGTFHCGIYGGGPCRETTGLGGSYSIPDGSAFAAGFHTFSVELDRSQPVQRLVFRVDGYQYYAVNSSEVPAATWQEATGHGFFLLLDVAVGGNWPKAPDATTRSGASMLVDQVLVRER